MIKHKPQSKVGPLFLVFVVSMLLVPSLSYAQVKGPAPYVSEQRDSCIAEMAKDPVIRAECHDQWSGDLHEQDAARITKNNKHVIAAYALLWIIVTGFVVGLWLRQRKLSDEITRLEAELKKAAAE